MLEKRKKSVLQTLREEGRIDRNFESSLAACSLEELIAAKLEVAVSACGGVFYGFPLWGSVRDVVAKALLQFAFSYDGKSKTAAMILGQTKDDLKKILKRDKIRRMFNEDS